MEEQNEVTFNTCKKKGYSSRKVAKRALKSMNKFFETKHTSVYFCEKCQEYHTTTIDKSNRINYKK
jgi:hypothetical protein